MSENRVVIGFAGNGTKVHKAYGVGNGISANCMNNSFNGQIHSVQFETECIIDPKWGWSDDKKTEAVLVEWLIANPGFDVCGKCFRSFKKVGA
jgi:hypothetical protein